MIKKQNILAGVLAGIFCLAAAADDDMRVFTDRQGRAIFLKVIKCDIARDEVTVEREDGRRLTVNISGFSDSDQAYVKEWFLSNELVSERNLKIACDDETVEKRKEEITQTTIYTDTDITEETVIGYKRYEVIAYNITLENRTADPIANARLEYKIYYEQSERGIDVVPVKSVLADTAEVPVLESKKPVKIQTKTVEIFEEDRPNSTTTTSSSSGSSRSTSIEPAEGEVIGIRGRLIIKLASGKEVVREFCDPSSLSDEKYPWNMESDVVKATATATAKKSTQTRPASTAN